MLSLWVIPVGRMYRMVFRPIPGGVKVFSDGNIIRVRLPGFHPSLFAFATIGLFPFIALAILSHNSYGSHPPLGVMINISCAIFCVGAVVLLLGLKRIYSGNYDLIINEFTRVVGLPNKRFGKKRAMIEFNNIIDVKVEAVKTVGRQSPYSTYAPTLHLQNNDAKTFQLVEWYEKDRAEAFAAWLRKQIGIKNSN